MLNIIIGLFALIGVFLLGLIVTTITKTTKETAPGECFFIGIAAILALIVFIGILYAIGGFLTTIFLGGI